MLAEDYLTDGMKGKYREMLGRNLEDEEMHKNHQSQPKKYKAPLTNGKIIETLYKKQMPNLPGHLEMVEKMIEKKEVVEKPKKKEVVRGGAMVVEGSVPVHVPAGTMDVSNRSNYLLGNGQPSKMQRRQMKIKEIMKQKGLSMIKASSYIKDNKIEY